MLQVRTEQNEEEKIKRTKRNIIINDGNFSISISIFFSIRDIIRVDQTLYIIL